VCFYLVLSFHFHCPLRRKRDRFVSVDARRPDDRKRFVAVSKILVSGTRRRFDVYSTTKSNSSNSCSSRASTAQNIRIHTPAQRMHTNRRIYPHFSDNSGERTAHAGDGLTSPRRIVNPLPHSSGDHHFYSTHVLVVL